MNAISIPPIAMATLMFYVGFYHFLIYCRQKDNRENLTFALSCFGVGLYAVCCAGLYNVSSPEVGVEWQRFQVISLAALAVAFLWFIAGYTSHTNRKIVKGFTLYYLFAALVGLLIRNDLTWTNITSIKEIRLPFGYDIRYNEMAPGILTEFQSIVGLIYFLYIIKVGLKFYMRGNKEKGLPLLVAISMLFAGSMNDTFVSSGLYDFIYILEYSYIGMILMFTFFLTNMVIKASETKIALLKSEKKYKALFDKTNDAIFIVEKATGRYLDVNNAALELTGRALEELKKLTTNDVTPGDTHERFSRVNKFDETKDLGTVIYHRPDNSHRIAKLSVLPMNDIAVICIAKDITHDLEVEKMLRQSQKMEAIGTLAGGIAHDFNNILSGIFGYSHLAKTHINNSEKAGNYIDQLTKGAQKATELIQQILMFSRKSKPEKYPLKISLVIKEALQLLRSTIPTTISIKDNIVSGATVLADPAQIHQIIMNLCTNAYHAMRKTGGILAVSLKEIKISDKDTIPGLSISPGNYLKLEVSDDGHGLDSKTLDKIFEPYFTTKEKGQGTGLGLSVVIGIVEEHNGLIKAYSEPELGTTFHIYLPITDKESVSYTVQKKEEVLVGGTERIIVVDDDETILEITHEILKDHGYKMSFFTNGKKALETYEKDPNRFDLIITDMTMPVMTGLELSKKILEIKPDQPIILCTGHSELINKEKAVAMGISEYFEKPVIANKLIKTIRKMLDKQK